MRASLIQIRLVVWPDKLDDVRRPSRLTMTLLAEHVDRLAVGTGSVPRGIVILGVRYLIMSPPFLFLAAIVP